MAAAAERETKAPRRLQRVLLNLTLAALFTVGIVVLMLALAGSFEPKVKVGPDRVSAPGPAVPLDRPVAVVKLIRRPRQESAVGTIRAVYEAVVASKILARVEEVRVKAGQEVSEGDVLVLLDKADLKSRIEQALADGGGGQGQVRPGRDRPGTCSAAAGPRVDHPERARPGQNRDADGEGRPGACPAGGGGGPDRGVVRHRSCPDLRPGHRQEGQRRRHRQPGPAAGDHVRPQPHATDRHGEGVAGLAAEGRAAGSRAARHARTTTATPRSARSFPRPRRRAGRSR